MTGPLHYLTIAEAAPLIERKELSPVELTEAFLERIEVVNPKLDAYLRVTPERARADARRAADEIATGRYRGPLHGIPIGLKDIYDTAGMCPPRHSHRHSTRGPDRGAPTLRFLNSGRPPVPDKPPPPH